jgi:glycine cleavage system H protein
MNSSRRYSRDHEWVLPEGNGRVKIGITDHAQKALGDIVYVELPQEGDSFAAGDALAVVESVKAASDVFTPVSGTVAAVNSDLENAPEQINEEAMQAWIAVIELSDPGELDALLDEEGYRTFCEQEG